MGIEKRCALEAVFPFSSFVIIVCPIPKDSNTRVCFFCEARFAFTRPNSTGRIAQLEFRSLTYCRAAESAADRHPLGEISQRSLSERNMILWIGRLSDRFLRRRLLREDFRAGETQALRFA